MRYFAYVLLIAFVVTTKVYSQNSYIVNWAQSTKALNQENLLDFNILHRSFLNGQQIDISINESAIHKVRSRLGKSDLTCILRFGDTLNIDVANVPIQNCFFELSKFIEIKEDSTQQGSVSLSYQSNEATVPLLFNQISSQGTTLGSGNASETYFNGVSSTYNLINPEVISFINNSPDSITVGFAISSLHFYNDSTIDNTTKLLTCNDSLLFVLDVSGSNQVSDIDSILDEIEQILQQDSTTSLIVGISLFASEYQLTKPYSSVSALLNDWALTKQDIQEIKSSSTLGKDTHWPFREIISASPSKAFLITDGLPYKNSSSLEGMVDSRKESEKFKDNGIALEVVGFNELSLLDSNLVSESINYNNVFSESSNSLIRLTLLEDFNSLNQIINLQYDTCVTLTMPYQGISVRTNEGQILYANVDKDDVIEIISSRPVNEITSEEVSLGSEYVIVDTLLLITENQTVKIPVFEKSANKNVSIYPNPANDDVYISIANGTISSVKILDNAGRLYLNREFKNNKSNHRIITSHIPAGMYSLLISTSEGQVTSEKLSISH